MSTTTTASPPQPISMDDFMAGPADDNDVYSTPNHESKSNDATNDGTVEANEELAPPAIPPRRVSVPRRSSSGRSVTRTPPQRTMSQSSGSGPWPARRVSSMASSRGSCDSHADMALEDDDDFETGSDVDAAIQDTSMNVEDPSSAPAPSAATPPRRRSSSGSNNDESTTPPRRRSSSGSNNGETSTPPRRRSSSKDSLSSLQHPSDEKFSYPAVQMALLLPLVLNKAKATFADDPTAPGELRTANENIRKAIKDFTKDLFGKKPIPFHKSSKVIQTRFVWSNFANFWAQPEFPKWFQHEVQTHFMDIEKDLLHHKAFQKLLEKEHKRAAGYAYMLRRNIEEDYQSDMKHTILKRIHAFGKAFHAKPFVESIPNLQFKTPSKAILKATAKKQGASSSKPNQQEKATTTSQPARKRGASKDRASKRQRVNQTEAVASTKSKTKATTTGSKQATASEDRSSRDVSMDTSHEVLPSEEPLKSHASDYAVMPSSDLGPAPIVHLSQALNETMHFLTSQLPNATLERNEEIYREIDLLTQTRRHVVQPHLF